MKQKLFVWIICTMMLMLSVPVMAGEANTPEVGSITADIHTSDGTKVPGGTLTAYKVAEAKDGEYQYVDAFKECPVDLKTIGTNKNGGNGEPGLAKTLAVIAEQKELKGMTVTIDQNGRATFQELELGYYLIVQETPAKGYQKIAPFSVTVPMKDEKTGEYLYDVNANPKPETAKPTDVPEPTGTPVPTKSPTPTVTPVPGNPVNPIKPAPLLPQTGQLWWPVPLFAIAGAVLLITGLVAERRKKGNR